LAKENCWSKDMMLKRQKLKGQGNECRCHTSGMGGYWRLLPPPASHSI
jgi:hypothetical protein